MLKIYTDAASGTYVSGVGYVVEGEVNASGKRVFDERLTSMEAEFLGLQEGLRIASLRSESREYCEAYVDVKPLIDKMHGNESNSDEWQQRRQSYLWLSNKFDTFELRYVPRESNEDAHNLARQALQEGRNSRP